MKRFDFTLATLFCVLITGFVLVKAGWLTARAATVAKPRSEPRVHQVRSADAASGDAALRWRRCQPHHWRTCLLHR